MLLRLTIENMDRLPDGGPVRVQVEGRGLDIGRDQHLDWTLPDPSRQVSSKHCEIRFRDGGYWLHDVSTNGTFVNGAQFRLDAPHLLRSGDRLSIGQYIVAVEIEGQRAARRVRIPRRRGAEGAGDLWGAAGEAAAPDDRRDYAAGAARARRRPTFSTSRRASRRPISSHPRPRRRSPPLARRRSDRRTIGCAARLPRPSSNRSSQSRRRRVAPRRRAQRRRRPPRSRPSPRRRPRPGRPAMSRTRTRQRRRVRRRSPRARPPRPSSMSSRASRAPRASRSAPSGAATRPPSPTTSARCCG